MRLPSVLTLAFALVTWSSVAAAQHDPGSDAPEIPERAFSFGSEPGWQLLGGLSAGGAFGTLGGGGFAGVELSISRLHRRFWWGGFLDATYDFAQQGAMATIGPEFGYGFVGIDGGIAARVDAGEDAGRLDYGPQARLLLTAGFVGLYGRYVYLLDGDEHLGQAGILLKIPLWAN